MPLHNQRPKSPQPDLDSHTPSTLHASWRLVLRPAVWAPPTDVYETDEGYVVRVEIAGMQEEDIQVGFEPNHLSVSGSRPAAQDARAYHRMEIASGAFAVDVDFPLPVDPERIRAEYHNGILRVVLPRLEPNHISFHGA